MTICDKDLAWIKANLDVLHTELTELDIHRWLRLMEEDTNKFYSLAAMGFALRRSRDRQQARINGAEMGEFCGEFMVKIIWAANGLMGKHGMPLFEIVGDPVFTAARNHLGTLN